MQIGVIEDDERSRIRGRGKRAGRVGDVRVEVRGGGSVKRRLFPMNMGWR